MNIELVEMKNGLPVVNSKKIAESFGMPHRSVLRAIAGTDCSAEFGAHNFVLSSYLSTQNKRLPCYDLTRDGFAFLCMGFTGKKAAEWKERYINAFNQMEKVVRGDVMEITLTESINIVSLRLDEIKAAGSAWGKTGAEIRKYKKSAIEQLYVLLDKAQMQLGFDLV